MRMNYWLLKSEPESYSIDDLKRDGSTTWVDIRNYSARNIMRDEMKPGDLFLFYHSMAKPNGIVGGGGGDGSRPAGPYCPGPKI